MNATSHPAIIALLVAATPAFADLSSPPPLPDNNAAATGVRSSGYSEQPALPPGIELDALEVELEENPDAARNDGLDTGEIESEELDYKIQQALETGNTGAAEKLLTRLLGVKASPAMKRDAILKMSRKFEEKKENAKALVLYEQFLKLYPNDPESPDILMRAGRIYRDSGAFTAALNKFYNVLYSSLQVKSAGDKTDTSLRAKMEIAHTHFAKGDYETAAQLYDRIQLIDMTQTEASEVAFRLAFISYLNKDYPKSLSRSQAFLAAYPASPLAPEAQYINIQSLRGLGRTDEAMRETLELLRSGQEYGKKKPAVWVYWQRKTGNEIANDLYESGDVLGAHAVFLKLAEIEENDPNYRGAAVYQIGLCFERLRHLDRARDAYKWILEKIPSTPPADSDQFYGDNLAMLREMAQWRLDNLAWLEKTEKEMFPLLDKPVPAPDTQPVFMRADAAKAGATIQTAEAALKKELPEAKQPAPPPAPAQAKTPATSKAAPSAPAPQAPTNTPSSKPAAP